MRQQNPRGRSVQEAVASKFFSVLLVGCVALAGCGSERRSTIFGSTTLFQAIFNRIDLGSEHRARVEISGSGGTLAFRLIPSKGAVQVPAVVQRVR